MDEVLFESLLAEGESVHLDFKAEQYKFSKATPEERAELVKDILGFANATRRADSYILIGVKEQPSGPAQVLGIDQADQLQDHAVQGFLTPLLNRPVKFASLSMVYEGNHVGVIRVDQHQARPFFLTQSFGKLQKDQAYVRRGSGTDLHLPARPDEIEQWVVSREPASAELDVQFVGEKDRHLKGKSLVGEFTRFVPPPVTQIPDYSIRGDGAQFGDLLVSYGSANKNYWRQLAAHLSVLTGCVSLRVAVSNTGKTQADNVRVEIDVPRGMSSFLTTATLPNRPKDNVLSFIPPPRSIAQQLQRQTGHVEAVVEGVMSRLIVECGSIQPGRRVTSDPFFFRRATSGENELVGTVYAGNLPRPYSFTLSVNLTVHDRAMTLEELQRLPDTSYMGKGLPWILL